VKTLTSSLPNRHIFGTRKNFNLKRLLAPASTRADEHYEIESESLWRPWDPGRPPVLKPLKVSAMRVD
jgi:hypothetical protein